MYVHCVRCVCGVCPLCEVCIHCEACALCEVYMSTLQSTLADHSGHQWVTSFQESAETLLNVKADQLGEMRQNVSCWPSSLFASLSSTLLLLSPP